MTRTSLAVGILALIASTAAIAGRPLQTEDAGVLAPRDCEIEVVGARESARDTPSVRDGSVQLGCGIGLQSQAAVFAGRSRTEGERADALALVGKTALRELTDTQTGVVVAWAVGGERARGQSLKHAATELKAVVTHPAGPWLLHANVGWSRNEIERRNATLWSAAAERTGIGAFDLMGEVFGDDRDPAWINAGLRWNAMPGRLAIDGSYGLQMAASRARRVTLGAKLSF
jgi:hypothetical protein